MIIRTAGSLYVVSALLVVVLLCVYFQNDLKSLLGINQQVLDKHYVENLHQVITRDSSNSRMIMWQSSVNSDDYNLEYTSDKINGEIKPVKEELIVNNDKQYVYTVLLENLESNTNYQYRIDLNNIKTKWYDFMTANKESDNFKVIIYPDSQSSDYRGWQTLAMKAWKKNQDAAFFVNMGDLVDNGYDLDQWNAWFASVEPIITKIPIAPVEGNHETYTLDWQSDMPKVYTSLFNVPENGEAQLKNQYYSFDYGEVHFVVLNTQGEELKAFLPELDRAQLAWLEKDLKATDKNWKIVLMHKDVLVYGRDAAPLDNEIKFSSQGKQYMPIFDKYGVDAVLTAHLHTYRRRTLMKHFEKNQKGTLYILTGVAGDVRYPNLWHDNPLDEYVAPQPETDNYLILSATDDTLTFSAYLPDGTKLDSFTLHK